MPGLTKSEEVLGTHNSSLVEVENLSSSEEKSNNSMSIESNSVNSMSIETASTGSGSEDSDQEKDPKLKWAKLINDNIGKIVKSDNIQSELQGLLINENYDETEQGELDSYIDSISRLFNYTKRSIKTDELLILSAIKYNNTLLSKIAYHFPEFLTGLSEDQKREVFDFINDPANLNSLSGGIMYIEMLNAKYPMDIELLDIKEGIAKLNYKHLCHQLRQACRDGDVAFIKSNFVKKEEHTDIFEKYNGMFILSAIKTKSLDQQEKLDLLKFMEGRGLDLSEDDYMVLMWAVNNKYYQIAEYLMENRILEDKENLQYQLNHQTLFWNMFEDEQRDILKILFDNEILPDAETIEILGDEEFKEYVSDSMHEFLGQYLG